MILALLLAAANPTLGDMEQLYRRSEFEQVIALATKKERAAAAWPVAERTRYHELVGLSHLYLDDLGNAEKELRRLLALAPDYRADKKRHPPNVVDFIDGLRAKIAEVKIAEVPAPKVAPAEPPKPASAPVAEPKPRFNPLSLIPFGFGQFALGDYVAGGVFFALSAACFATNLSLYLVRVGDRSGKDEYTNAARAQQLQIGQNVAAAALVAVAVIGFIDALAWSPGRVAAKKKAQLMVAPTGDGLSVFGTF